MIARLLVYRQVPFAMLVATLSLVQIGCTHSDSKPDPAQAAYAASGGIPPGTPAKDLADATQGHSDATPRSADDTAEGQGTAAGPAADPETPLAVQGTEPTPQAKGAVHTLPPDLSVQKLIEFLANADKDMQVIFTGRSGITDPKEARDTLIQIVKLKLEASRRLSKHAEADASVGSEGARGELQSLSHLAALGDLKSAEELEQLAEANLKSKDAQLVSDSRLVMIGFAIESLHNGDEEAANRIVSYLDQIAASATHADVPTMMVMGQARESLASYGHDDQAKRVRDLIIELFADSAEPEIAKMAAELAGNVRFDAIEKLRSSAMDGETVDTDQWRAAVGALVDESADLQTVQYLAGAALELESRGLDPLVEATYAEMTARFDDPGSATGREVQLAVDAMQARQEVMDWEFESDLLGVDGSPLNITDYRGKVVLMPFWAMGFPESLQLVPRLKAIHDANPDKVAIIGMNLDAEGAEFAQFLRVNDLGFRSYRAESSATAKVANPMAARFGMVSMPFVVILDQEGRVSAINFTGRHLEETVQALLDR